MMCSTADGNTFLTVRVIANQHCDEPLVLPIWLPSKVVVGLFGGPRFGKLQRLVNEGYRADIASGAWPRRKRFERRFPLFALYRHFALTPLRVRHSYCRTSDWATGRLHQPRQILRLMILCGRSIGLSRSTRVAPAGSAWRRSKTSPPTACTPSCAPTSQPAPPPLRSLTSGWTNSMGEDQRSPMGSTILRLESPT